jgi:hypothetical protein
VLDLQNQRDIGRLYEAIRASRQAIAPYCRERWELIDSHAGNRRNDRPKTVVNLINQYAESYTQSIATNTPRVVVLTPHRHLKPFALRFQSAINKYLVQIHSKETFNRIVLDAFFGIGVAKVYRAARGLVRLPGDIWADPGRIALDRVSLDNFVVDMTGSDDRHVQFMGDAYRTSWPKLVARCQGNPDALEVLAKLHPTSKQETAENDDWRKQVAAGDAIDSDDLEPQIDVMDVWLPELNAVATFPRDTQTPPLFTRRADPGGPYHIIGLGDIPDSVMPAPPVTQVKELHEIYNGLIRKQAAQARRQKTNPVYRPGGAEDASRLKKVNDGEWVQVADPQNIGTVVQGGIEAANVAFSAVMLQTFDRVSGNLQAQLGLSATSPSFGQEQLIYGAVGKMEARRLLKVQDFASGVADHLGALMWHDALLTIPGRREVAPGSRLYVDATWQPRRREGAITDYAITVVAHSTAYQPPEAALTRLDRALTKFAEVWPMIEAGGGSLNVEEMLNEYAERADDPALRHLISIAHDQAASTPTASTRSHMPAHTIREQIRRNVSAGRTPQAQADTAFAATIKAATNNTPPPRTPTTK